ncbi:hypothetical protein MPTK1_3g21640 [Marchantia polymorpha subsp. ruderalis]|uniref:Uncharacterized protein n=2 Tax=Marchantia polymorpha TaxID=3197 RepID=A0AAF6B3B0_MARPO|nr:hypothetical protein MARPO_0089s0052 [Marchantia polymorpha]BBN06494.1 hypothetical protein Mp_3g21640 [Marchantia polymorpha subsp. ruderalis]|eukprot:PTQ33425.1 hypothetical protein MARPO_0089s0052 [Marchantia polymorpha]
MIVDVMGRFPSFVQDRVSCALARTRNAQSRQRTPWKSKVAYRCSRLQKRRSNWSYLYDCPEEPCVGNSNKFSEH